MRFVHAGHNANAQSRNEARIQLVSWWTSNVAHETKCQITIGRDQKKVEGVNDGGQQGADSSTTGDDIHSWSVDQNQNMRLSMMMRSLFWAVKTVINI